MIEKDGAGSEVWPSTPLIGHLPGDPGTEPPHARAPNREGGSRPGGSSLTRALAYAVAVGTLVLGIEIVAALVSIQR